jgi:hypothetical protein
VTTVAVVIAEIIVAVTVVITATGTKNIIV